jgi:hypothetical protein
MSNTLECGECGGEEFYSANLGLSGLTVMKPTFGDGVPVQCSICLNCGHVFTFIDDTGLAEVRNWHAEQFETADAG